MESRANYAAIGLFVLVMIMTGLGFLYWLTNAGEKARQAYIRVVFSEAVTGLNTGSAVLFNGIKVGEVADLSLDEQDPNTVIAFIRVDRTKPIRTDTRATLSYQGLTGVSNLQLEGGSRNAPLLLESVDEGAIPTIHAEVSPFQDILESARNVLTQADSAMGAIDDFIAENGPAFNRTVNNVETFSRALADNSDRIGEAIGSITEVASGLREIAANIQGTAERAEQILAAVDPAEVGRMVDNLTASSEQLNRVLARAEEVAGGIDPAVINTAVQNVADAASILEGTIARADTVVQAVDPQVVRDMLASLNQSSTDIGSAARRADALMAAVDTEAVASIVKQAGTIVSDLSAASSSVGGVITSAQSAMDRVGAVAQAVDPAVVNQTITTVSDAATQLRDTIASANQVVAAVDATAIDEVVTSLRQSSADIGSAARQAEALIASIDTAQIGSIIDQIETVAGNLSGASGSIGTVVTSTQAAINRVTEVVGAVDPAVVRSAVADVSDFARELRAAGPQVSEILADAKTASESLRSLGETIEARTPDVDAIVASSRDLVAQLNGIAARTDGILRKVDAYVEGDGEGLITEATATLESIREVAATLNERIGPITDNVAQFTDRGLDSFTSLAEEGRRALSRLDRVLSGVERNPQQFIFGGEGVPEYAPRRR